MGVIQRIGAGAGSFLLVFMLFMVFQGLGVSQSPALAPETVLSPSAPSPSPPAATSADVATVSPNTPDAEAASSPPPAAPTDSAAPAAAAAVVASTMEEVEGPALLSALRSCPADNYKQSVAGNTQPVAADLEPWTLTEDRINAVCKRRGLARLGPSEPKRKLIYAVMFGLEFDMLEVVLHEVAPVADVIFVTESTVTHSLGKKKLHFDAVKDQRFRQFLPKIQHLVYSPVRTYKSGWDIEKRQRNHFLRYIRNGQRSVNVSEGDVVVGNIDLDEILSRDTLIAMKYCESPSSKPGDGMPFKLVHFRYSTNCIQEAKFNTYFDTAFRFSDVLGTKSKPLDLYKRRLNRDSRPLGDGADSTAKKVVQAGMVRSTIRNGGAWHFTAFGGVKAIMDKYRNSPHRFVGSLSEADVVDVMNTCKYQDTLRWKLPFWETAASSIGASPWWLDDDAPTSVWPPVPLPYALTKRPCAMLARGWFR